VPELDRHGVAVHYDVHGQSTGRAPLVLTHGYSATSAMWAPNLAALSEDRQVITWDLRGHGRSQSPADPGAYSGPAALDDLAALLDVAGAEQAVLGGQSLGGYLSLAFHLVHPERVAALVLVDTGPGFRNDQARQGWNDQAEAYAVGFETRGLDALGRSPEVGGGPHDPLGLALAARGILVQHDGAVMASLGTIAVPTLVLVGERDRPFLAAADVMAAKIPGATKVVLTDAGHAANLDQPAAFDAAVTSFLAALADPATG
jgi:pimeloyl-ACP methyl ester carboxylesterase